LQLSTAICCPFQGALCFLFGNSSFRETQQRHSNRYEVQFTGQLMPYLDVGFDVLFVPKLLYPSLFDLNTLDLSSATKFLLGSFPLLGQKSLQAIHEWP